MQKLSNYNAKAIKLHRNLIAFTFSRHFYMILKAQKSPRKCIPLSILKIIVMFAFLTLCKQSNAFSLQNVRNKQILFLSSCHSVWPNEIKHLFRGNTHYLVDDGLHSLGISLP